VIVLRYPLRPCNYKAAAAAAAAAVAADDDDGVVDNRIVQIMKTVVKISYAACFKETLDVIVLLLTTEFFEINSSNKNAAPKVKKVSVICAFVRHIIFSSKNSSNFCIFPKIAINKSNNKSFRVYIGQESAMSGSPL
jgi:hypothetical protein